VYEPIQDGGCYQGADRIWIDVNIDLRCIDLTLTARYMTYRHLQARPAQPHVDPDALWDWQTHDAGMQVRKSLVQRDAVRNLSHGQVGMLKELLLQMDAQHTALRNGDGPVFPAGACGPINASNSDRGMTRSNSSRNACLRVRLVASSNPVRARRPVCSITVLSQIRPPAG
jgi:hypothetical protein